MKETIDHNEQVHQLISVLHHFHPQDIQVVRYFERHLLPLTVPAGTLLQVSGDICNHIYFIVSGVLRGFIKESEKDITTWISSNNELVTSITSFDLEVAALENIEAIEDCSLLAITNQDMQQLYDRFPEFNVTGRKLLQHYYRDAEKRAYIARLSNAETKYKFFLDHYHHLSNRIQLKYIASYLGITIETLSRVRKRMATS